MTKKKPPMNGRYCQEGLLDLVTTAPLVIDHPLCCMIVEPLIIDHFRDVGVL